MKISLDALLVFDSITRNGSYAAAAKELCKVPSAITYTIKKLEDDLDISLFTKSGRQMVLTTSGKQFLEVSNQLLIQAKHLESNASQIASGWESELRIAVNDVVPQDNVLNLVTEFYKLSDDTNVRLTTEVLSGSWDSLLSGRSDLIIGAPHNIPPKEFELFPFCELEFVFVVAKNHPLALQKKAITDEQLKQYRVAVVGDSSRSLSVLNFDVFEHQKIITFASHSMKIKSQISGLCIGSVAKHLVKDQLNSGALIIKKLENTNLIGKHQTYYACRKSVNGKASEWFIKQLKQAHLSNDWLNKVS